MSRKLPGGGDSFYIAFFFDQFNFRYKSHFYNNCEKIT